MNFVDVFKQKLTENEFKLFLSKFLFSSRYAKYQANFRFAKELECGIPAPDIVVRFVFIFFYNHNPYTAIILDVEH